MEWQLAATAAAMLFNASFISQVRITYKNRDVQGLSLSQWLGFAIGTMVFIGFYANLHQWLMVSVSVLGLVCTISMCLMIIRFRRAGVACP